MCCGNCGFVPAARLRAGANGAALAPAHNSSFRGDEAYQEVQGARGSGGDLLPWRETRQSRRRPLMGNGSLSSKLRLARRPREEPGKT